MNRITTFLVLILTSFVLDVSAQNTSAADKLFSRGVTYMKTMTIASQKKAIAAFGKAKVAYDSKSKKDLCDEQITACYNIIKKLSTRPIRPTHDEENQPIAQPEQKKDSVEVSPQPEITLSVNPSRIELNGNGGKYVEIIVDCNVENWEIESSPSWVKYTITEDNKILLKAEINKEKGERAGVVTIVCGNKKAEILVKQKKRNLFDKGKDWIGI